MRGSLTLFTAVVAAFVVVSLAAPADAGQLVSRSRSALGLNAVAQAQGFHDAEVEVAGDGVVENQASPGEQFREIAAASAGRGKEA